MANAKRLAHAPAEPIPELDEYLALFQFKFRRRESRQAAERYLTGLLTEHPNKNCDTLAAVVPGTSQQQLQGLLTDMVWDEQDLTCQRVRVMQALPTEGDGVLVVDDTGFGKQGNASVGVARQYSGTLGKVANCQVTVNCHYAERTLAWPVATRLYLPDTWANDAERRKTTQVPPDIRFQTKVEIALDLVDQAKAWGVQHAAVVADANYGDNPAFLNGLEARGERVVANVRASFTVATARRPSVAGQRADELLDAVPRWQWRTIRWREGSTGWLRAKFVAVRCWRVDGDGTHHIGWLTPALRRTQCGASVGQRPGRGQASDPKYFWSNCPADTALERMVEYAHRRAWVEQFHEEAKQLLGWDQYQGRLWPGFHRNAALVMLSYCFLVWLEWRQRQSQVRRGRPRRAFSPSAGLAPDVAAGHPSAHR